MFTLPRFLHRATRNSKPSPQRRQARLRLEALEDRCVLSTLTVTNNADDITLKGTLRYAVANAASGDRILITPAVKGDIVLTHGELLLDKDLTIEMAGNKQATISGNEASRVFEIASNARVTLSNLTITQGRFLINDGINGERGAGIYNSGSLSIDG
jgi:hypothetical protein